MATDLSALRNNLKSGNFVQVNPDATISTRNTGQGTQLKTTRWA